MLPSTLRRRELFEAVMASPEDDAPRLAYAAWLRMRGDPLGEFIELDCSLAGDDAARDAWGRFAAVDTDPGVCGQRARRAQLLARHRHEWEAPLRQTKTVAWDSSGITGSAVWHCSFARGFVERVALSAADLETHGGALLALAPIGALRVDRIAAPLQDGAAFARIAALDLTGASEAIAALLTWPRWRGAVSGASALRELTLRRLDRFPVEQVARLVHLERLTIEEVRLTSRDVQRLAHAGLPALRRLRIASTRLGSAVVRALADSSIGHELQHLELEHCGLGRASAAAIAAPGLLPELRHLGLAGNRLGSGGARALAGGELGRLVSLDLAETAIGSAGLEALAIAGALGSLRRLGLAAVGLEGAATARLFSARQVQRLAFLDLGDQPLGDDGAVCAARMEWVKRLRALLLDRAQIGDAGVRALASSPRLAGLRHLGLAEARCSSDTWRRVRGSKSRAVRGAAAGLVPLEELSPRKKPERPRLAAVQRVLAGIKQGEMAYRALVSEGLWPPPSALRRSFVRRVTCAKWDAAGDACFTCDAIGYYDERRPSAAPGSVQLCAALAADPDGVERAEALALELATLLTRWGAPASKELAWTLAGKHLALEGLPRAFEPVFDALAAAGHDRAIVAMGRGSAGPWVELGSSSWETAPKLARLPNPFRLVEAIRELGYDVARLDEGIVTLAAPVAPRS
jgi:uncharacterized protein (TIGR02996 family)